MAQHEIVHIEWPSSNLARTKKFYGGLFNWKFQAWGEEYMVFSAPKGPGGGFWKAKGKKMKPAVSPFVYVDVKRIEPYLAKAKKLGGRVAAPKKEIPDVGWYAQLADPDKNLIGVYQRKPR